MLLISLIVIAVWRPCGKCGVRAGDLNCCHPGGSWEARCGAPGEARHTWKDGYAVCNYLPRAAPTLMVIVPGHDGSPHKSRKLVRSMQNLLRSAHPSGGDVGVVATCSVYVYSDETYHHHVASRSELHSLCELHLSHGMWTHHMLRYRGAHDFVAVMMDDVEVDATFSIHALVEVASRRSLSLASASLKHSWHWSIMQTNKSCLLRRTRYTDVMLSVFRMEAFQCWLGQIDPDRNAFGWGYDLTFAYACNASIGIVDTQAVSHHGGTDPARGGERTHDEAPALKALWQHLSLSHVPALSDIVRGDGSSMGNLIRYINGDNGECEPIPAYHLIDPSYFETVEHRGGWGAVMRGVIDRNVASLLGGHVQLIDCAESFFLWQRRRVPPRLSWVGIVHYTPHLPHFFPRHETLQGLLQSRAFQAGLGTCKLLIAMSESTARWLRARVRVPVGVVHHPMIGPARCDDHKTAWPPQQVVFLGTQYRRVSTIYSLRTNLPKVWLPGTRDKKKLRLLYHRDPDAVRSAPFESVPRVYLDAGAYEGFLRASLVVIDLWDASANNAVLEVIASGVPAFVTRLPATVEYLGDAYPLLFDNATHLQMLLHAPALRERLRAARVYLCSAPVRERQTTVSDFAMQIELLATN